MSINKGYIGLLFYDIPVQDHKMRKSYEIFRKTIKKYGYYQIQESVYACKFNYKNTANTHIKRLQKVAPIGANIRMLILTKIQFNNMLVISGEISFNEKILAMDNLILEL